MVIMRRAILPLKLEKRSFFVEGTLISRAAEDARVRGLPLQLDDNSKWRPLDEVLRAAIGDR